MPKRSSQSPAPQQSDLHLVSFLGTTDVQLAASGSGPIVTAVRRLKPAFITLVVTESSGKPRDGDVDFMAASSTVKRLLEGLQYDTSNEGRIQPAPVVYRRPMTLDDPTDHNEIYPKLRLICSDIVAEYTHVAAAISSGTPAMQVCWILLAESGEVPLTLYRTIDPNKSRVTLKPVKLDTHLPRILGLEKENTRLAQRTKSLEKVAYKPVRVDVQNGRVLVGDVDLNFSRRQFTYYRYFLDSVVEQQENAGLRIERDVIPDSFIDALIRYDKETWPREPDPDILRLQQDRFLDVGVVRSNLSKLNKKIVEALNNTAGLYKVDYVGRAKLRMYTVHVPADKIRYTDRRTAKD